MPSEKCNRILVEKYFLGEGPAEEKRAVRAHIDACADCRAVLATLESDKQTYLLAHPYRAFAARHAGHVEHPEPKRVSLLGSIFSPRYFPVVGALAACLVLVPLVLRLDPNLGGFSGVSDSGLRAKGGPLLEFYYSRDGKVQPGQTSQSFQAGDELQFVYSSGGYSYVTLVSVDAQGHVSLYKPDDTKEALSLGAQTGDRNSLPFAVKLDDSDGGELFIMTYTPAPMVGAGVEAWLKKAFADAGGNLDTMESKLVPPPGPHSALRTLLLRKTRA